MVIRSKSAALMLDDYQAQGKLQHVNKHLCSRQKKQQEHQIDTKTSLLLNPLFSQFPDLHCYCQTPGLNLTVYICFD